MVLLLLGLGGGGGGGVRASRLGRWGPLAPLLLTALSLQFLSLRHLMANITITADSPPSPRGEAFDDDDGGAPAASFRSLSDAALPPTSIDGTAFPRGRDGRLYMGTGLWNSAMSLPAALGAMLGDGSAYVESPAFTACRLRLMLGDDDSDDDDRGRSSLEAAVGREVFGTRELRRDWLGYYGFARDARRHAANCTPAGGPGPPPDAASAARLARSVLDARFRDGSRARDLAASLASGDANEPADLLYATVHPYVAAQYYGPSLVVMGPDREGRGLDLGYYSAVGRKRKQRAGAMTMSSCDDVPGGTLDPDVPDSGEVLFPGYRRPSDVVGFEVRREASRSDEKRAGADLPPAAGGKEVPSVTHAFYGRDVPGAGRAVFFLHLAPGRVHCVAEDDRRSGNASGSRNHSVGSFFECKHGGRQPRPLAVNGSSCAMANDMAPVPSRPLGTLGLVFAEGDFAGGCDAAARALGALPPEHRGVPTKTTHEDFLRGQAFQDVLSGASSRLGRGVFVAHFVPDGGVECGRVVVAGEPGDAWQGHRDVAASHVGLDASLAMCAARVPAAWEGAAGTPAAAAGGGAWEANVTANRQSNPLGRDAFGVGSAGPAPRLTKPPDWNWLLDPILDASNSTVNGRSHPCWGYMGSTCEVDLVSAAARDPRNGTNNAATTTGESGEFRQLKFQCTLECTYAGVWLAPPDAPPSCHWLARDLVVPIAEKPDSPMGFEHLILAKWNRHKAEPRLMTQAEADPLHLPPPPPKGGGRPGSMNVVLTSDVHGLVHGACDGGAAPGFCSSGAPALASLLDTVRRSSSVTRSPVLVLDAGDALHGSGVAPGDVASVMNGLGVDAMALGNHELDLGADGLRDAARRAGFPILAANVGGLPFLGGTMARHARIGDSQCAVRVVGLSAPEPNPFAGDNLTFAPDGAVAVLERELGAHGNASHCNVNILLSHMGYDEDAAIARSLGENNAASPLSLDLILGGHSHVIFGGAKGRSASPRIVGGGGGNSGTVVHRSFPHIVGGVPIAHVGANGMFAGLFSVETRREDGPQSSSSPPRFVVRGALQALGVEDGVFPRKMALPRPQKMVDARPILVQTHPDEFSVCNAGCRRDECLAGNFVANAMRQCILDEKCGGASRSSHPVIALLESGTLRGCIKYAQDDMTEMLPWLNKLVVLTVKGSTVRSMLEHGVKSKVDLQGGGFLQTSGLRYRYRGRKVLSVWESETQSKKLVRDSTERASLEPTAAFDSRVLEERVPTKMLDDHGLYSIVITDWVAFGGDGFGPIVAEYVNIIHTNTTLQSAVLHYSMQQPIVQIDMRSQNADDAAGAGLLRWLAAFVGSLMATVCSYPLYSMSVLRATSMGSLGKDTRQLYDGVYLASFAGAMSNAFFYLFYHILSFKSPMIRAFLGAVMNVILTNPLWVVITRIQTRKSKQPVNQFHLIFHTTIELIRDEGYLGFFDGLVFNLIMCIYPSIRQVSLEVFQSLVLPTSHTVAGLCGMAASCIANFITYPIQRWRVRQQAAVHGDGRPSYCTGLCDGVMFKVLHSGVAGFIFFAVMSGSIEMLDIVLG